MSTADKLRSLHETYCRLTGLELRFGFEAESIWFSWQRDGYTEDDLVVTIAYVQRLYCKQPRILAPCLRLHKLIGDLLNFGEYLAEARKIVRVREEHSAKESVLRATGRATVPETKPARSAGDILKAEQAFRELLQMKNSLK